MHVRILERHVIHEWYFSVAADVAIVVEYLYVASATQPTRLDDPQIVAAIHISLRVVHGQLALDDAASECIRIVTERFAALCFSAQ